MFFIEGQDNRFAEYSMKYRADVAYHYHRRLLNILSSNVERFLNAFISIEQELYRMLGIKQHTRFYNLIKQAVKISPVVARYQVDLMEYADLRNVIVHKRKEGVVLAEPNQYAVEEIEKIASYLLEPPRVLPKFKKPVVTVEPGRTVAEVVKLIYKHDFSQIPVQENGAVIDMVTASALVCWLGKSLAAGSFEPYNTPIYAVLPHDESMQSFIFVDGDTSLFEIQDLFCFHEQRGNRLEAILITKNGLSSDNLLGIITIWDLPAIQKEIDSHPVLNDRKLSECRLCNRPDEQAGKDID